VESAAKSLCNAMRVILCALHSGVMFEAADCHPMT
jgi:hypothetical protein